MPLARALGAARRRVRRRGRFDAAGAARSQARRAPDHRRRHDRNHRGHQERAGQACQRHRLRSARDRQRGRAARHRPAGARQPGALELSPAAAGRQRPRRQRGDRGRRRATAGCRLADPQPHQRHAGAGAQRRALHPVPDARRPHRAAGRRRRRRQRGEEPHRPQARRDRDLEGARRDRRPGVRDLSVAGAAAVGDRRRDRARGRRGPAVRHRGGVRRDHPAADRARAAAGRTGAGVLLRAADRARLRALAARPRP